MELVKGQEIFVNGKWWFDIINIKDGKAHCKIEYTEGEKGKKHNKTIKIAQDQIKPTDDATNWTINDNWLRKEFGSLINRIVKSKNVYSLLEDAGANVGNSAGMGSVSMAGLSGSPGVPGSAGSGDISGKALGPSIKAFPKGTYGIENLSKNIKQLRKLAKKGKVNKMGVKKPLLDIFKEAYDNNPTENDYKRKLYDFLDYPWERENESSIILTINEQRPEFGNISSERIMQYLRELWKINYSFINNGCSEQFIEQFIILGDVQVK